MIRHEPIALEDIRAAARRLAGIATRTPLIPLGALGGATEIHLKLENLQPIRSFKLRGAANAISTIEPSDLTDGVWTASAGNMAQGAAWMARRLGVSCTVIVPDTAPATKRDAITRLGGTIVPVPFDEWFETFRTRTHPAGTGRFVHAFSDPHVMAGNGTIGLEILDDLPDVDAIVIPFGGGGLAGGIASAVRAIKSEVRLFAAEVDTGAPLAASLAVGRPVEVPYTASFVDGIGGPFVSPEMFDLSRQLLDGSLVVSLAETADALRRLAGQARIVAEGAGAVPVAAALAGRAGTGKVVCVVSGGNIDLGTLAAILRGEVP